MCPLSDGVFNLSESATHQEEYFLQHDHYYGTKTRLSMSIPMGNLLKSGLTVRHAYWKKINILLLKGGSLSVYCPCREGVLQDKVNRYMYVDRCGIFTISKTSYLLYHIF